jgi:hypothetical protein
MPRDWLGRASGLHSGRWNEARSSEPRTGLELPGGPRPATVTGSVTGSIGRRRCGLSRQCRWVRRERTGPAGGQGPASGTGGGRSVAGPERVPWLFPLAYNLAAHSLRPSGTTLLSLRLPCWYHPDFAFRSSVVSFRMRLPDKTETGNSNLFCKAVAVPTEPGDTSVPRTHVLA